MVLQVDVNKLGYPGTAMSLINVIGPRETPSRPSGPGDAEQRFRIDVVLSRKIELSALGTVFAPECDGAGSLLRMPNPGELRCKRAGIELLFEPNVDKESCLRGFGTFVRAPDFDSAVDRVRTVLFPLLSYVSFRAQVPLFVAKIVGTSEDRKQICARFVTPDRECWIESSFGAELSGDYQALFAAYRESKNSPSYFYKFICLYKILEAVFSFYRPRNAKRAKAVGIDPRRDGETIPDLEGSGRSFPKHVGKSFQQFFNNVLTQEYRKPLVHFFLDKTTGDPLNLDDAMAMRKYEEIYPVMDHMVRTLLENEITIEKVIASRMRR